MGRFQRAGGEHRTTALELFYDLVFVFAVTQVSHLLLDDLTWRGVLHAAIVLAAIWWSWNYTTWATNELDLDSPVVRALVLVLMLGSLLMAAAIPGAFGERAGLFVGAYVATQVGRTAFLTFVVGATGSPERRRAGRILTWFAAAAPLWIAGAIVAVGSARAALWLAALAVEYAAPLVMYRVPGLPRLEHSAWEVRTAHFAERFQLFVIIALGESIVMTGATTASERLDLGRVAAFATAFATTAAMWWLYFTYVARIAERRLELAADRTAMARDGYTYLHVVLVAGIIVAAVGDEVVIAGATRQLGAAEVAAVVAGPAIYLLGHALFRLRLAGSLSAKRLVGALGCVACGALGTVAPALVIAVAVVVVLAAVITTEELAAVRRTARGEPSPLERLEAAGVPRVSPPGETR